MEKNEDENIYKRQKLLFLFVTSTKEENQMEEVKSETFKSEGKHAKQLLPAKVLQHFPNKQSCTNKCVCMFYTLHF